MKNQQCDIENMTKKNRIFWNKSSKQMRHLYIN